MSIKEKVRIMLELQDSMNTKVHPQWKDQNFPFYRAIWVECAELLDHYGYKWWKKQEPNMEQVKLELIDIWHFGLSEMLMRFHKFSSSNIEDFIDKEVTLGYEFIELDPDFKRNVEHFSEDCIRTCQFDPFKFTQLLTNLGMSFDELYSGYIAKNVLNFFRQDNGYQEGTYTKRWNGKEDNEVLVEIMKELREEEKGSIDLREILYQKLKEQYLYN